MLEHYLIPYGLFVAQTATLLFLVLVALLFFVKGLRAPSARVGQVDLQPLDLQRDLYGSPWAVSVIGKQRSKAKRKALKAASKEERPKGFVLSFHGDVKASGAKKLAEEINAILEIAEPGDTVVLKLESPGGSVAGYGLAASHLERIKTRGIKLQVTVDKVAASGGYLMAVVADQIWATSFAVVGSIGVVASMPNFKRLLDDKKVDFEQITAGEYKRTLTLFGENTDQDRAKVQSEVDAIHNQFKGWVKKFRPELDLAQVATGEWWQGEGALELGLIDHLGTSDELLHTLSETHRLYAVNWTAPKSKQGLVAKLLSPANALLSGQSPLT